MTKQPRWKMIANLGDVHPIEYGGLFLYVDRTGVYPPELEKLDEPDAGNGIDYWEIHRVVLEPHTYTAPEPDGGEPAGGYPKVLSDNQFHPLHPVWYADKIHKIAETADHPDIIADLCSDDPLRRAFAYRSIGDYYGWNEFDSYPTRYTKKSDLPRRIRRMRATL